VPEDILHKYAAYDVYFTEKLFNELKQEITEDGRTLRQPYYNLLIPGAHALARARRNGVRIDQAKLKELELEQEQIARDSLAWMQEHVGNPEFNPRSVKQLQEIIYETFGAPTYSQLLQAATFGAGRATGSQKERTTAAEHLERMVEGFPFSPFIKQLLAYKKSAKMLSTWIKSYATDAPDQRVHPSYLMHSTVSGRLSSVGPNIMNPPRSLNVRSLFTAAPGNTLVSIDYSQAELRVLAVMSDDPTLRKIYIEGQDLHAEVAKDMFGTYDVSKDQRAIAKAVNFGIVYGAGGGLIAAQFGISPEEGQDYVNKWFSKFPRVGDWRKEQFDFAIEHGYVETLTHRKKRFPLITSDQFHEVTKRAVNTPIQGTASDCMLLALIQIDEWIGGFHGMIVLPLHDSIMFEIPTEHIDEFIPRAVAVMEAAPAKLFDTKGIPFLCDAEYGQSWGDMTKYKKEPTNENSSS